MKINKILSIIFILYTFYLKAQSTIIINELMIDPEPPVLLPNSEYIELKNVSNNIINLNGYYITDNSKTAILPNYNLNPNDYVIIVSSTQLSNFQNYNNVIGVSNFPTLNNDFDTIILYNSNKQIIHSLLYNTNNYNNPIKNIGGWSLEMIDSNFPYAGENNWNYSTDNKGGTPSSTNSISKNKLDTLKPLIINYEIINPNKLKLYCNKSLDSNFQINLNKYYFNDTNLIVNEAIIISPLYKEIVLKFNKNLVEKTVYNLNINLKDKSNNYNNLILKFGIASNLEPKDIIINEILFNPLVNENPFIEIYNTSDKIIDLRNLIISRKDNDIISQIKTTNNIKYIFPKTLYALTNNIDKIKTLYPNSIFENILFFDLPTMLYNKAKIAILNKAGNVIDELEYNQDWHYPYLITTEGVSLERINYNLETQNKNNWYSSAYPYWATPTLQNAQFKKFEINSNNILEFNTDIITPNQDGINDYLLINYSFEENGNIVSIKIFNLDGSLVNNFLDSTLLPNKGTLQWNGTGDNKSNLPSGNYIFYVEIINPNGKVESYKKIISIALQ